MSKWLTCPRCGVRAGGQTWDQASAQMKRHIWGAVERTDGRSAPGEKHQGCRYFVLDLDHDPHAGPAIRAYADSCEADFPALARDLRGLTVEKP